VKIFFGKKDLITSDYFTKDTNTIGLLNNQHIFINYEDLPDLIDWLVHVYYEYQDPCPCIDCDIENPNCGNCLGS